MCDICFCACIHKYIHRFYMTLLHSWANLSLKPIIFQFSNIRFSDKKSFAEWQWQYYIDHLTNNYKGDIINKFKNTS
jgi:hypothetical protein